jgi:hypothetical protein
LAKKIQNFHTHQLHELFFTHFFPNVKGHGLLTDKYHSDSQSLNHHTYITSNFKFHESDPDQDPDWKIKQCYLLLLAAVTESDVGVENLWKKGKVEVVINMLILVSACQETCSNVSLLQLYSCSVTRSIGTKKRGKNCGRL